MKKITKLLTALLLVFEIVFFTACSCSSLNNDDYGQIEKQSDMFKIAMAEFIGSCLTAEETLQLLLDYESVQKYWSGKEVARGVYIPELKYVPPEKHERTEDTRYEIDLLEKDKHGFYTGIKVSVMDDTSACKIPDSSEQTPVEDNTGNVTEETTPVETDNTQNVEHKESLWKLNKERTYTKEGDPTSFTDWRYSYIAEELFHIYKAYLPANEYHEASDTAFTAKCSAPPEIIRPGETISFTLDLNMVHYGGMLVTASSYMLYGTPDEDGKGLKYNGAKFGPAKEDQPNTCAVDTMGENINHVVVSHTFDDEGTPGSELGIIFYGSDCITLWIYEWAEE